MNPTKRKKLLFLKKRAEELKTNTVTEVKVEEVKAVEPVVVPEPVVEAAVETLPEVVTELQPEVLPAEETISAPAPTGKKKKSV